MSEDLRHAKIKCAAILHEGKVYEGNSHGEIGRAMIASGACKPPFPGGDAQGFVTEGGMFLNRYQSLRVAANACQVVWGETINKNELFSKDLRR